MTDKPAEPEPEQDQEQVVVVEGESVDNDQRAITELVEQPAKVMRIGAMIRTLLEEAKSAPLDEATCIANGIYYEYTYDDLLADDGALTAQLDELVNGCVN